MIESRVLRGGAWNNNQDNARADYRNHNHPDNRNNNIGFRVVCSSHIRLRPPHAGRSRRSRLAGCGGGRWMARARPVRAPLLGGVGRIYKLGCRLGFVPRGAPPLIPFHQPVEPSRPAAARFRLRCD
ncbi:MAG: SUMF1/EgtB/PvdO family nonheme iron enzyme [Bryobacterales bacterium]|nr:SUMF1/EgtB/PvdO family nonheme iron enzyme [Bryobacterales bacterium]